MSNKIMKAKSSSTLSEWVIVAPAMEFVLTATMIATGVGVAFYLTDG